MKPSNTVPPAPDRLRRVGLGLLVTAVFALTWWALRSEPKIDTGASAPVASAPASAVKLPPLPFSDAAPVLGPERSALEARAARLAATAPAQPRDPAAASAAFRSALERYVRLRYGGGTPVQLQEVARILDAGIDARVDRNEITLPDALELMAELLDVLEPDPARRGVLLAQWREQKLGAAAPAQPRDPDLARREAARVAAWQAEPAAQRDARELEWQIRQLREPLPQR